MVAAKSSEDGSARVQGYQEWRGQKMQTPHDHSYPFRCCWYCSRRSYASISAGQGEAGTLANCIYGKYADYFEKKLVGDKVISHELETKILV